MARLDPLVVAWPFWLVRQLQLAPSDRETQLGTFHQEDVRPDTVDRSFGRGLNVGDALRLGSPRSKRAL